jgi:hypothetical protein
LPFDRRLAAFGLLVAARAENERVEFAGGLFEVVPGVALVADDELARGRLAGEQRERRLALGRVCWDEVKVADASVWAADEDELHSPVEAGVASRVAEAAPGGEFGAVDGLHALPRGNGVVSRRQRWSWKPGTSQAIARQSVTSFGASCRQRTL